VKVGDLVRINNRSTGPFLGAASGCCVVVESGVTSPAHVPFSACGIGTQEYLFNIALEVISENR
jgi:hypothetical protein